MDRCEIFPGKFYQKILVQLSCKYYDFTSRNGRKFKYLMLNISETKLIKIIDSFYLIIFRLL